MHIYAYIHNKSILIHIIIGSLACDAMLPQEAIMIWMRMRDPRIACSYAHMHTCIHGHYLSMPSLAPSSIS